MLTIAPDSTVETDYVVALSAVQGRDESAPARKVTGSNASRPTISIYTDANYDKTFGEATGDTGHTAESGSRSAHPVMLFGRVPDTQIPASGSIAELLLVTLSF
jgi:spore coat protein U-like protein